MVGGALEPSRLLVDAAGGAGGCQGMADEDEVDAQPQITTEGRGAIIPPAETVLLLFKQAEGIRQPQLQQRAKCLALRCGTQDAFTPCVGVVHVTVLGCNIKVPQNDQLFMFAQLGLDIAGDPGQPLQLPGIFVAADLLAIDDIEIENAQTVAGGGENTALGIV